MNLSSDYDKYIMKSYGRFDLSIECGESSTCSDFDGNQYLDFTSGIGVNSLGFCDKDWADAVSKQAHTLNHTSNLYYTKPALDVAELICEKTGLENVFFANSGAEANEGAVKIARKYSFEKYGKGRDEIITLENSFHGRTVTTLAATGQDFFHNYFFPFTEGFVHAKANDILDVDQKITDKTCAIMIELVQGEGGVIPLDSDFVSAVQGLCTANDILLIVDEVQTGIGRTGSLFAFQQFPSIEPDLVTVAKGLGGGLPIGAIIAGKNCKNTLKPSDHATTFGGNPIVCAGAKVVLEKVSSDEFLQNVSDLSLYLKEQLSLLPQIEEVSGMGLMLGAKLAQGLDAKTVVANAIKNGLLILTAKDKLRFLPPLTINKADIDKMIELLKKSF